MSPAPLWTAEQDETLANLLKAGDTARKIGLVVGKSRNAVIGRAHRLGLHFKNPVGFQRKKTVAKDPTRTSGRVSQPAHGFFRAVKLVRPRMGPMPAPVIPDHEPEPRMVALMDLRAGDCRYPLGDPRDAAFGFCGHPTESSSYCPFHRQLAYVPPMERRKAAA